MTEIPDDVMKAAYDAALDYRHDKACDPIYNDDALQLAFARAILAERERCATLAVDSHNKWAAHGAALIAGRINNS